MSTRSWIGIEHDDRSVEMIYCQSDGYPSYNGRILHEHYQDTEKVKQLMTLGPISSLAKRLAPSEGEEHSFVKSISDVVVSYGRDRKDDRDEFHTYRFKSTEEMLKEAREELPIEYVYVHTKNGWVMWDKRDMNMRLCVRDVLENDAK